MADYKPIRPIKLSGRALYDDEQMIRPIKLSGRALYNDEQMIKLSGRASYDAGQIPRAELPGRGAAELRAPAWGTQPGSGEERCLRAAGSTHIWRHSALFSPVNTKTSEKPPLQ